MSKGGREREGEEEEDKDEFGSGHHPSGIK